MITSENIKKCLKEIFIYFMIYAFWCFAYGISVELFHYYCQVKSIKEYLLIPFYNEIPHCKAFIWIQHNSYKSAQQLILTSVSWIMRVLTTHMLLDTKYQIEKKI